MIRVVFYLAFISLFSIGSESGPISSGDAQFDSVLALTDQCNDEKKIDFDDFYEVPPEYNESLDKKIFQFILAKITVDLASDNTNTRQIRAPPTYLI